MTKKNTNKEEVAKNAIDEEESLDLDELQSVFTEDGDESIDSSDEEESPFQLLLKKGKNEGFITYAELNENLPSLSLFTVYKSEVFKPLKLKSRLSFGSIMGLGNSKISDFPVRALSAIAGPPG